MRFYIEKCKIIQESLRLKLSGIAKERDANSYAAEFKNRHRDAVPQYYVTFTNRSGYTKTGRLYGRVTHPLIIDFL